MHRTTVTPIDPYMTPNITMVNKETLHRFSLPSALIDAIRNKKASYQESTTNDDNDDDLDKPEGSSTTNQEDKVGDDETKKQKEEQHQQKKKNVKFHPNVLLRRVPKLIDLDKEKDDNDIFITLNDNDNSDNEDTQEEESNRIDCRRTRQSKFWYTKQELIAIKLDNHTTVDEFMKSSYRNRTCRRSIMNHRNDNGGGGSRHIDYSCRHANPNNLCWETTNANVNHDGDNDTTLNDDEMRGLEFLTYHGHCYRKQIQDAARTPVLLEQASQHRQRRVRVGAGQQQSSNVGVGGDIIDTDMIALVYYNFTKRSQHDAHMVGLQDERYVLLQNEQQPTASSSTTTSHTTAEGGGENSEKSTREVSLSISTATRHEEQESKHAPKISETTTVTTPTTKFLHVSSSSPIVNGSGLHSNTVTEFQTMVSTPTKKAFIRLL